MLTSIKAAKVGELENGWIQSEARLPCTQTRYVGVVSRDKGMRSGLETQVQSPAQLSAQQQAVGGAADAPTPQTLFEEAREGGRGSPVFSG